MPALLAAEMTAAPRARPGFAYRDLCAEFGEVFADRVDARADTGAEADARATHARAIISPNSPASRSSACAIPAPGNGAPIGGIKVAALHGWFAARPSGTEDIYKIYAESSRDAAHLQLILEEAQHRRCGDCWRVMGRRSTAHSFLIAWPPNSLRKAASSLSENDCGPARSG